MNIPMNIPINIYKKGFDLSPHPIFIIKTHTLEIMNYNNSASHLISDSNVIKIINSTCNFLVKQKKRKKKNVLIEGVLAAYFLDDDYFLLVLSSEIPISKNIINCDMLKLKEEITVLSQQAVNNLKEISNILNHTRDTDVYNF